MQVLPQILVVFESATEAEDLVRHIHRSGIYPCWQRVDCEADYVAALQSSPEIIISDFALPQLSWTRALQLLKDQEYDIPFILVSEISGEESAVMAIKMGAFDYITKDKIARLANAVDRALERNRLRRECTLAEQAIQEGERKFRALFDSARDAIYMLHNGVFIDCNASGLSMFGRTWDQIVGHTPDEFAPSHQPDGRLSREKAFELVQKAMLGEAQFFEWTSLHASGLEVCSEVSLNRMEFEGSTYLMATVRDISERKKTLEALQAGEKRYRSLVKATAQLVWTTDAKGRVVGALPEWQSFTGQTVKEIQDAGWTEALHPDDQVATLEIWNKAVLNKKMYQTEYRLRQHDGIYRDFLVRGVPILEEDGSIKEWVGCCTDISDRKQAVASLKEAHSQLQYILDNTQDAIFQTDPQGNFIFASAVIEQITGYKVSQILNINIMQLIAPEYQSLADILAARVMEREILHREGHRIWAEITTTDIHDDSGRLIAIQGLIRDVTKRKKLEQQLLQSQKMDVVGQLAGGIAHDFNNILTAMMMQLGLINRNEALPPEVRDTIMDLKKSASKAAQLTRQLLLFARQQVMQSQQLNLNDVVANISNMLRRIIGEDIQLQIRHQENDLIVLADPGMLDQVLLNLVVNARDAMSSGGQLVIETTKSEITQTDISASRSTAAPYYCCLIVKDTGCGIAPEQLPRIFEPFFTTKDIGKGTGLGLATVFSIVNQHGGFIQVDSKVGEGTEFRIFLPAVEAAKSVPPSRETRALPSGRETILLVEDEVELRLVTSTLLKNRGYMVFEAVDGLDALKVFEQHRSLIRLVVTDIVMPGELSGIELAKKLRKLNSKIPILFTSGYSAEIAGREILLEPGQCFISKPYTASHLLESMRCCLEKTGVCNIVR